MTAALRVHSEAYGIQTSGYVLTTRRQPAKVVNQIAKVK